MNARYVAVAPTAAIPDVCPEKKERSESVLVVLGFE
jgi:hypothetical protein